MPLIWGSQLGCPKFFPGFFVYQIFGLKIFALKNLYSQNLHSQKSEKFRAAIAAQVEYLA